MGLLTVLLWCIGLAPIVLFLMWIIGGFFVGLNEGKAAAYLAKKYDDDRAGK